MCLNVKKLKKQGNYKDTTFKGNKGDLYNIDSWCKCGVCQECINEKANNWVVRNYYESLAHEDKCFITLTYANNPYVLVKKDFQDFLKRLRKELDPVKIRFFGSGEYGVLHGRPHYHAILYGWRDPNAKFLCINKKNQIVLKSDLIKDVWNKGLVSYQEFSVNEIPYIALYDTPNEYIHNYKSIKKDDFLKYHQDKYIHNKREYDRLLEKFDSIDSAYINVKEFNTWSIALGFDFWYKNIFDRSKINFIEYINEFEYMTPTDWIIKCANFGDIYAIQEYERRKKFALERVFTEEKRKQIKYNNLINITSKKRSQFARNVDKLEDF